MLSKKYQEKEEEGDNTAVSNYRTRTLENHSSNEEGHRETLLVHKKIRDSQFKANYDPAVLQKKTTLVLKTSFHLINYILMGMCEMF
jgi:hypothetical protein